MSQSGGREVLLIFRSDNSYNQTMKKKLKLLCPIFVFFLFCYVTGFWQPASKDAIPTVMDTRSEVELPVLMYHGITEKPENVSEYTILANTFENDLVWLKENGFTTISAKQLINYVENCDALPSKPVMITFDDGYKNNYSLAFPLLKKHNMKAVISVIGAESDLSTDTKDKSAPNLTWEQIKIMSDSGLVEIGSHTYDLHKNTASRKGADKSASESQEQYTKVLAEDLSKNSEQIVKATSKTPLVFAWPFGAYPFDDSADQILKELGFKITLTSYQIKNTIRQGDPASLYKLKRFLRTPDFDINKII